MPKKASTKAAKKKRRPLRPGQPSVYSKLDDVIESNLCQILRAGVPVKVACDAIGLPRTTFYRWEELGIQSDDPKNRYTLFLARVREAQAKGIVALHLKVIQQDPKWLLARIAREHYPPETLKAELSGPAGQPIATTPFVVEIRCDETLQSVDFGPIIDRTHGSSLN